MARRRAGALADYARKRDFTRTREPAPRRAARPAGRARLSYCVQQHAASRLHYDFRLELDGVLLSWSVPKGPSLDPADKRLAGQVEGHPVDYAGFEGGIPEGEDGGGTVLLWDRGTWEPVKEPRDGLRRGRLEFELHGRKLTGGWALVRMGGRANEDGRQWLLIKRTDGHARPGEDVLQQLRSVKSGLDIGAVSEKHRGTARQQAAARAVVDAIGARPGVKPRATRSRAAAAARAPRTARPRPASRRAAAPRPRRASAARLATLGRPGALPAFVEPELATLVDAVPEGEGWLHEIKFDGYRLIARVKDGAARLWSRNRIDWTAR